MLTDKLGNTFHVGCKIVRAIESGYLDICTVTNIKDNKLYLDDSKVPIKYHKRLLIIEQDPLFKLITAHTNKK